MKKPKAKGNPVTPKAHAHSLERAWFVVERIIPFDQLLKAEDLRPGRLGPKRGVPWDALLAEMKRTHPHLCYSISRGKALGDLYRRAVSVRLEENGKPQDYLTHVASDLLAEFGREFAQALEGTERALERLRQWYASRSEKERERRFHGPIQITEEEFQPVREAQQRLKEARQKRRAFLESLSPEEREAWEKREAQLEKERIQRERDAIARRDLIGYRAFTFIWFEESLRRKSRHEELMVPLRPWFLLEARGEPVPFLTADHRALTDWPKRRSRMQDTGTPQAESSHLKATRRPASAKSSRDPDRHTAPPAPQPAAADARPARKPSTASKTSRQSR